MEDYSKYQNITELSCCIKILKRGQNRCIVGYFFFLKIPRCIEITMVGPMHMVKLILLEATKFIETPANNKKMIWGSVFRELKMLNFKPLFKSAVTENSPESL